MPMGTKGVTDVKKDESRGAGVEQSYTPSGKDAPAGSPVGAGFVASESAPAPNVGGDAGTKVQSPSGLKATTVATVSGNQAARVGGDSGTKASGNPQPFASKTVTTCSGSDSGLPSTKK